MECKAICYVWSAILFALNLNKKCSWIILDGCLSSARAKSATALREQPAGAVMAARAKEEAMLPWDGVRGALDSMDHGTLVRLLGEH